MFDGIKIIILAWSPIGYEFYLTLRLMLSSDDVILVSARNFNPPESISTLGINHHYFSQTDDQKRDVCIGLKQAVSMAVGNKEEFILFVPQTGNFYGRSLIESKLCQRFFIYDEGSAAYSGNFTEKYKKLWMRHKLEFSEPLLEFYKHSKVDFGGMYNIYNNGVKFYQLEHSKLDGLVSFFPDAFPGFEKIQIPLAPSDSCIRDDILLVILPPINLFVENPLLINSYRQKISAVESKLKKRILLKPHPSDCSWTLEDLMKLMGIKFGELYNTFACEYNISPYREVAVLGFKNIISYGNSTNLYIEQLKKLNNHKSIIE